MPPALPVTHRRETYGKRVEVNSTNVHLHATLEPEELIGLFSRNAIGHQDKLAAQAIPVEVTDDE